MAYNMKDVFYLDTQMVTGTSSGQGITTLDLSSYVDPIARGRAKGTGLAIYKVHFDIADSDGNSTYSASATGQMRAGVISFTGAADAAVGSGSFATNTLNAANDLMVAGVDFSAGGTAAGDPAPNIFLEPSADVPYVIVRDRVALMLDIPTAMSVSAMVSIRLECAQVALDQSTLNQLLRTQTV